MKSRFATPQGIFIKINLKKVHFVGEIKGAKGFEYSQLYCRVFCQNYRNSGNLDQELNGDY